jgi:putative FmdB family regulatory protein
VRDAAPPRLKRDAFHTRSEINLPLYEYVCANGHRVEVMHGLYETGPTECPTCGAPMRKAFVAPTIVFKGSGWAKMDRRSSSGTAKSGGGDSSSTSTSSSGESSAEKSSDKTESATTSSSPTESGPTTKPAATD